MSKAFTRESDHFDSEEFPDLRPQLPPGATNYITPEGAAHLKQRLEILLEQKRLIAAEADRRKFETNIRKLQQVLDSVVIADKPADPTKVAFGARVVIRRPDGEEDAYRIVGVTEANPEQGSISWVSPLARALLGRKVGDQVQFRSPGGVEELMIVSVVWTVGSTREGRT